jgi:hypothetical protein
MHQIIMPLGNNQPLRHCRLQLISSKFVAPSPAGTANGNIMSDTMLGSWTKVTVWMSDDSAGLNQVTLSPALISTDCGMYV